MDAKDIQQILEEQRQQAEIYKKTNRQINSTIVANNRSKDHQIALAESNKKRAQDPANLSKHRKMMQSDAYKQALHDKVKSDEYRELKREQTKQLWQDPEFRKIQHEAFSSPEVKEKQRSAALRREADPEWQKRKKEWSSRFKDDHERNSIISEKRKAYFQSHPEAKIEIGLRNKKIAENRSQEDWDKIYQKRIESGWLESVKKGGSKKWVPLVTPAGIFACKKHATEHYGFDSAMIDYWRKKKPNEWYNITREEYTRLTGLNPWS